MKSIETKRFILLPVELTDAENIYRILSNEKVIENLNMDIHKTIEDTTNLINKYLDGLNKKTMFPYKIIDKVTGEFIGVYLNKIDLYDDDCFEFTIYLSEEYWGRGIYSEVLPYMINQAFEVIKTGNYRGFVMEKNIASRKVLEKSNMKLEKVFSVPGINEPIYSFLITKEEWCQLNK